MFAKFPCHFRMAHNLLYSTWYTTLPCPEGGALRTRMRRSEGAGRVTEILRKRCIYTFLIIYCEVCNSILLYDAGQRRGQRTPSDPSTGWQCRRRYNGTANQYWHLCYAESRTWTHSRAHAVRRTVRRCSGRHSRPMACSIPVRSRNPNLLN